jgi:phosphomannomutase
VGISIYPTEWDKIQVLKYIQSEYNEIHYFGDRYQEDGNDFRIIHDSHVIGHCVNSYMDTMEQLNEL